MCSTIVSSTGHELLRKSELRYLGVYLTRSKSMRYSLDEAKRGFYRAANSIFGKIGRTASKEVTLHLIKSKCVPILLYGLETLFLTNAQLNSLDFVPNCFLMKLFNTNNMEIINTCREQFKFSLPSQQILVRNAKFMASDGAKIDIMKWYCVQL